MSDASQKDWKILDEHVRFKKIPEGFRAGAQFFESLFGEKSEQFLSEVLNKKVRDLWKEAAGPLARHSQPSRLRGKTLEVLVEKSIYSQEIQFYKQEILKYINKKGDMNIGEIRVKIGTIRWMAEDSGTPTGRKPDLEKEIDPILLEGLKNRQTIE